MASNFWSDTSSYLGNELLTTQATTSASTVSLTTTTATLLGLLNYSKLINFVNGNLMNQTNADTTTTTTTTTTTILPTTTTRKTTTSTTTTTARPTTITTESLTSLWPIFSSTGMPPEFSTWPTSYTETDTYDGTTIGSTDYWDFTDDESTFATTTRTTTTTPSPHPPKLSNNVSFFYFHDYFAGLPLQYDETLDFYEEQLGTSTIHSSTNKNEDDDDDDDDDDNSNKRMKRQIYDRLSKTTAATTTTTTITQDFPIIVPPFRTSIYSRRKHGNITKMSPFLLGPGFVTTDPEYQISTTTTVATTYPTTTTMETTTMSTTMEYTEDTTFMTTTPATTTIDTELDTTTEIAIYRNDTTTPKTLVTQFKSTAVAFTQLQQYEWRLKRVQKTLKEIQINLTSMCWETSLGQELSKVIVFDGVMGILVPLCIDLLRAVIVRYGNRNFCWDMEKTFPQYGDFKIAENILSLIYNQGQVWMGIFFSPGLVLINLVKLVIMMYFRSFIVLTCNVPHEVVFKASKSNNFYLTLLLTMLFLCVLPVGYAIVWLRPSWHCGPFSHYNRISEFITNTTRNALPKQLHEPLNYLTSSSTVIPLLLLLVLIIYYLVSLTGALREANQDLRTQLHKEREEERKKMFPVQEESKQKVSVAALSSRWRKVLEVSSSANTQQRLAYEPGEYQFQSNKELLSRIVKNALRKSSATSEDDSTVYHVRGEDDTDNEHHDALPADEEGKGKPLRLNKRKLRSERAIAEPTSPGIDADEHSRVLHERRQSLLRYKTRHEESISEPATPDIIVKNEFDIVDEKKTGRPLSEVKNNSKEKGLFKSFKAARDKRNNASKSQPENHEVSTVSTMQNLTAEHFRTLSRASFKKFNTFLTLVRETVHANKAANETAMDENAKVEEGAVGTQIVKALDVPVVTEATTEKEEQKSEVIIEADVVAKRIKTLKSDKIPTIMISMDSDDEMIYMHDIPAKSEAAQVADCCEKQADIEEPSTADPELPKIIN